MIRAIVKILVQDSFESTEFFVVRLEGVINNNLEKIHDKEIEDVKVNFTATDSGRQTASIVILYSDVFK
jgi:hypothetical protein